MVAMKTTLMALGCAVNARFILLLTVILAFPSPAATIDTFAGTGEPGYTGDGGPATKARINSPFGVVRGPDGALYLCDTFNHAIRRVDGKSGIITTVAGTGQKGWSGDGGLPLRHLLRRGHRRLHPAASRLVRLGRTQA